MTVAKTNNDGSLDDPALIEIPMSVNEYEPPVFHGTANTVTELLLHTSIYGAAYMDPDQATLVEKIVARADADNLPADHELRKMAADLDQAVSDYFCKDESQSEHHAKRMIGLWARTRMAWCKYSGEQL